MKRASIAFLWHMHQPSYVNPFVGEYRMPWVFLHGIKDYYDMPALLEGLDDTRVTINLVPLLLAQIRDYEHGTVTDRYLRVVTTRAEDLSDLERTFIGRFFFPFPDEILRQFSPRLLGLKKRLRAAEQVGNGGKSLSAQEYRDVQVLFLLAWCGVTLRGEEPVKTLLAKGKDYSEDDKVALLAHLQAFMGRILPEHAAQMRAGRLDVSVSPYSHPILPLLIDVNAARVAKPGSPLPNEPYAYPLDVRLHLVLAQERYREVFGHPARGMWPSEGSVSPEAMRLIREAGIEWICTDRAILEKSLGRTIDPADCLVPYRYEGVTIFFRDTKISDLIGFTYAPWKPDEAVADFLRRVRDIASQSDRDDPIVTVAMDGENAWEHFAHGGYRFLRELYEAIEAAPDLRTVTFEQYLAEHPERPVDLAEMGTGSWIYGDFATWIGDPIKNRAWDLLSFARREVEHFLREYTDMSIDTLKHLPVVETTLRAESSDWFWWYGEGHSSINDPDFDDLFRANLRFLYTLMGKPSPANLDAPLAGAPRHVSSTVPPQAFIRPVISGDLNDYFEWHSSGTYELQSGALARVNPVVRKVFFGFDEHAFYLRVDTFGPASEALGKRTLELRFLPPIGGGVRIEPYEGTWRVQPILGDKDSTFAGVTVGVDRLVELAVPLERLFPDYDPAQGVRAMLSFNLRLYKSGMEIERFPWDHDIDVLVNTVDLDIENWFV